MPAYGVPVRRWTGAWARQLLVRFLNDPQYRLNVVRRAAAFAMTGKIRPDLGGGFEADSMYPGNGVRSPLWDRLKKRVGVSPLQDVVRLSEYQAFVLTNQFTLRARQDLEQALELRSGRLPKLSLVTPLFDTPTELIKELADCVTAQVYENFEWRLVDDASRSRNHLVFLKDLASNDHRIHLHELVENGGISFATNTGVKNANGEIIVFIDHDDLVTPDCLAEIAIYFADNPNADIVYSDDDKISMDGERFAPQFKPDYSPVLLLSHMYMGHVLSVRKDLFESVGGFRREFDGSQDYDFVLRATEQARHTGHIPRVLYNWRVAPGSTASSGNAKPESFERGRRAVQDAVKRRGLPVARAYHPEIALTAGCGLFSLEFPHSGPKVCLIVPTHNGAKLLAPCVASLRSTLYQDFEVMVVDNDSDDPETLALLDKIKDWPGFRVEHISNDGQPFSYARINNLAVRRTSAPFLLFLNDDTKVVRAEWLSQMMGYAQMPGVGAVGARLLFEDGSLQHAGIVHGFYSGMAGPAFRGEPHDAWGNLNRIICAHEVAAVTAACMLTPKDLFLDLGGFDEQRFAVTYNDVDYCYRLADRGKSSVYCADAILFHYEGKTRGHRDNPREIAAFKALYTRRKDAFYNPNLSLDDEHFRTRGARRSARNRRPIRVGAFSHNLEHEGATNSMFELVTGLKHRGVIDPIIFAPANGPLRQTYAEAGLQVQIIPHPLAGVASPEQFSESRHKLASALLSLGVDVVYGNTLQTFWAISAAESAGIPAIWNPRESDPCDSYFDFLPPPMRPIAYRCFHTAYGVVFVAEATRRHWDRYQTRHNFRVIANGISLERLTARGLSRSHPVARQALGLKSGETAIVLVGTVCERKGQIDLVEAIRRLPVETPFRAFIVGDREGPYSALLHASIAEMPEKLRNRITVVGETDDACLYFQAADIAVCTSRIESYPRVILEAMAHGLPIVTTPVFGIPEQVREGVNALFYAPGDAAALAAKLMDLISHPIKAREMAAASPVVMQGLTGYDDMLESYSDIFREALLTREGA